MSVIFDFFQFTGQFFGYKSAELGMFVLKVSSPNSTTFSPLQAMSHLSPPISIVITFKQLRRGHIQIFTEQKFLKRPVLLKNVGGATHAPEM